jgi:hypothetical protein
MNGRFCLLVLLAALPAYSQVEPSAADSQPTSEMKTPPPVSNLGYPAAIGAGTLFNYLKGEVGADVGYISNMYAGSSSSPIAEKTVSIHPSIDVDHASARREISIKYSPEFIWYEPSSERNEFDQNATVTYRVHMTPHTNFTAVDRFQDSSTEYGGQVSGGSDGTTQGAVPPFAKRLTNSASVEASLQMSMNGMIGASGQSTILHYPDSSEIEGVSDSRSWGATGFYNRRLTMDQYCGFNYQYSDSESYPASGTTVTLTHAFLGYYTLYTKWKLTLSVSGGPQRYISDYSLIESSGWGAMYTPSMGWENARISLSANYSQSVTGGGGLTGAYHSKSATANLQWRAMRKWTLGATAAYSSNHSVSILSGVANNDGHSVSGSAKVDHSISDQWSLRMNYTRLHQIYDNISAIAANPDADRVSASVVWRFSRSLGR